MAEEEVKERAARGTWIGVECSDEDCTRTATTKGLCGVHYRRNVYLKNKQGLLRTAACGMTLTQIYEASTDTHKHCTQCGEFRLLTDFYVSRKSFLGRQAVCKLCTAENRRRDGVIETRNRQRIYREYGEEGILVYERILSGEGCAICGGVTVNMNVDHDHATGKVREPLCTSCNTALGQVKDNVETLKKMIDYLERHRA